MTFAEQLAGALDALEVRSQSSYSWLGQVVEAEAVPAPGEPSWIVRSLPARLYADFYLPGSAAPVSAPLAWRLDMGEVAAVDRLSRANVGRGSPQPGWSMVGPDGDRVMVERDGLRLWARPEHVAGLREGRAEAGDEVVLIAPKERLGRSEGFYTMAGDAGSAAESPAIDRVYWHLRRDGAVALVAAASRALNAAGIPFRLKVANNPRGFRRCDTAVLYTRPEDREAALDRALAVRERIASRMRDAVPALTLRLAPGLAFAEDPGGGESYGASRTRMMAEAVISAWREGREGTPERLAAVAERFAGDGIDPERPYLGPGSDPGPELRRLGA